MSEHDVKMSPFQALFIPVLTLFIGGILISFIFTEGHSFKGNNNSPLYKNSSIHEGCKMGDIITADVIACQVVGMDEQSAKAYIKTKGFISRVVHRDGQDFIVTADYSTSRINLYVEKNKVFKAVVG
jgi:hypothetical protein